LDVITQVAILDILADLRKELGLTMMFLTHDMSIIARIADRVAVMYAAQVAEIGSIEDIFYDPLHPYTYGLIHAVPSLVGDLSDREPIPGSPPDLRHPPSGCRFHPRCRHASSVCQETIPRLECFDDRCVACHHWREISTSPPNPLSKSLERGKTSTSPPGPLSESSERGKGGTP
jgi:peptide/nickel transport system ATP-binding protein